MSVRIFFLSWPFAGPRALLLLSHRATFRLPKPDTSWLSLPYSSGWDVFFLVLIPSLLLISSGSPVFWVRVQSTSPCLSRRLVTPYIPRYDSTISFHKPFPREKRKKTKKVWDSDSSPYHTDGPPPAVRLGRWFERNYCIRTWTYVLIRALK